FCRIRRSGRLRSTIFSTRRSAARQRFARRKNGTHRRSAHRRSRRRRRAPRGGPALRCSTTSSTMFFSATSARSMFFATSRFALLGFAAIGFIDDYAKVSKQRNLGLTAKRKFSLQILISLIVGASLLVLATYSAYSTQLVLPFLKRMHPDLVILSLINSKHFW